MSNTNKLPCDGCICYPSCKAKLSYINEKYVIYRYTILNKLDCYVLNTYYMSSDDKFLTHNKIIEIFAVRARNINQIKEYFKKLSNEK